MLGKCGSAPDKSVAVAGRERVEEHVQGEEHALQAALILKVLGFGAHVGTQVLTADSRFRPAGAGRVGSARHMGLQGRPCAAFMCGDVPSKLSQGTKLACVCANQAQAASDHDQLAMNGALNSKAHPNTRTKAS